MCSSLSNEWGKEAQRGKWEYRRAHRKLRWFPRQHLAITIPALCLYGAI